MRRTSGALARSPSNTPRTGFRRHFVVTEGGHEHGAEVWRPAYEQTEQVEGQRVGPVNVFYDRQDRRTRGEDIRHPAHARLGRELQRSLIPGARVLKHV